MLSDILSASFKIKKLEINYFTIVLFVIGHLFGFFNQLVIVYTITAIHECAHIYAAKRCGVEIKSVEILPFGITMRVTDNVIKDTSHEAKIALAGPVANFLTAYFAYGFYMGLQRNYIIASSLVMGIFNLLPALPLDGGRIMRSIFVKKYGCIRATSVCVCVTRVVAFVIFVFGLYALYLTDFNFSFLLIGCFLGANITEERKNANAVIMKDILYSRKKLQQTGRSEIIVVEENKSASGILKKLSYDKYCIIHVIDENMKNCAVITETQLIEAMAVYGMNVNVKKIVEM